MVKVVYFSRKPGDKALGWSDVVMMQSMREPRLLPCGHVGDALSLMQMRACLCPICRNPFRSFELVALEASITQLTRIDKDSWKGTCGFFHLCVHSLCFFSDNCGHSSRAS